MELHTIQIHLHSVKAHRLLGLPRLSPWPSIRAGGLHGVFHFFLVLLRWCLLLLRRRQLFRLSLLPHALSDPVVSVLFAHSCNSCDWVYYSSVCEEDQGAWISRRMHDFRSDDADRNSVHTFLRSRVQGFDGRMPPLCPSFSGSTHHVLVRRFVRPMHLPLPTL